MQIEPSMLKKLREEQLRLKNRIILEDDFETLEQICGTDVSFKTNNAKTPAVGVAAIFDYKSKQLNELLVEKTVTNFPYIPTYLVYREMPVLKKIFDRYRKSKNTIFMLDGHGILHPFGIGYASHVGVVFDIPTIGVAKKLLCGKLKKIPTEAGSFSEIMLNSEPVGYALRTTQKSMVYISPGHRICMESALKIVSQFTKYSIPEPLRIAHLYSKRLTKISLFQTLPAGP